MNTTLTSMEFNGRLQIVDNIDIKDQKIYIELYKSNETYTSGILEKTIEKSVSDFDNSIKIENLTPKTYYYIKFKTYVKGKNESTYKETYLYDLEDKIIGKLYNFQTLATVGIKNITATYVASTYNNKILKIAYEREIILGYDKTRYSIYEYNEEKEDYELLMDDGTNPELLENNISNSYKLEKNINVSPSVNKFTFGKKYKIVISPIVDYVNSQGETQEVIIGEENYEFTLKELARPTVSVRVTRTSNQDGNNQLKFRISVYDQSKVIVGGTYQIRIYNKNNDDVTPEEYKGKTYSILIWNNLITLSNISLLEDYRIVVNTQIDMKNNGKDIESYAREYIVQGLDTQYNISIGDITARANSVTGTKVDLLYNNSYKLTSITDLKYSVYNNSGTSYNGTINKFSDKNNLTSVTLDDETYYTMTLPLTLAAYGKYTIELQFYVNGELIDTKSLEYVYLTN